MPLSWNEIKDRALAFAREWADETSEDAEAKSFWDAFFNIFGITRRRVASFEVPVRKSDGHGGYIDLLWKGMLLIEHKSRGKNLDRAVGQAFDYFPGIKERDLPRYVLVSDFARFRLHDLETGEQHEIELKQLHKHVRRFGFIAGYETRSFGEQDPANVRAAEKLGKLHDQLKASGYAGHALEVLLVRLLFCLFADDTAIFNQRGVFTDYLLQRTSEDGSDLGMHLAQLFQVLNTPDKFPNNKRQNNLDEQLAAFPYVNGKLFEEILPLASFNSAMRDTLLDACALDWSRISPAIFGSLFQSIMDEKARRNLGAHYTSETNILKLIRPLFVDELRAGFDKVKRNKTRLLEFHKKLRTLTFFDPACGCGNFLVIAYRELRELELDVLRAAHSEGQRVLDVHTMIAVDVDQFYGIEIEEFPAQIAQVALWLMDHQMNLKVSEEFGQYFARIPLKSTPHIVHGNALRIEWNEVLPVERCSYVLGNPPFVGAKYMDDAQRDDTRAVFEGIANAGLLDFVAAWYVKATDYLKYRYSRAGGNPSAFANDQVNMDSRLRGNDEGVVTRCAFVSTNSITQGEQVGVLWSWLLAQGIHIHFAHRTFSWRNEAKGVAAVHCVIIGFGLNDVPNKVIYEYEDIKGEPHAVPAININPYLVNALDLVLPRRNQPISNVPQIGIGNKPIDDGNYLFTTEQRDALIIQEPATSKYFRRWLGAEEFINGYSRWCLWLGNTTPEELRAMPHAMQRVQAVKNFRASSKSAPTRKLANTPTRFHVEFIPECSFMVIPEVSSERRSYIPMGFLEPDTLASNKLRLIPEATRFHFGVLMSSMHMSWARYTGGRLKSDYQYSISIVYNNFPWPDATDKQRASIEAAAQAVLDARAQFPDATLADLYDPLTMPPALVDTHHQLDRAVDAAYLKDSGKAKFNSEAERVAFLFERYQQLTSLLPAEKAKPKRSRKK